MRSGGIGAIQWPHIDWHGKFIEVRRKFVRGRLTTVKTKYGRRRIDLSDDLITTSAELRKQLQEEFLKKGSSEIAEWVFLSNRGRRVDMGNVKDGTS
ncbi:hypothetical protein MYX78_03750 [Acidobacteria bacterium AH-259-G07]|nr:hypothetical protein [Acidobacteria bacterium AH-259-G07]